MTVRTRIAPSPTGDPHVGTAYVALFNYCFAKNQGGSFILRIEDTDAVRSTRESEEAILEALRWCGLAWDEGPDVGGPKGPYRQSERSEIYREHVGQLLEAGHAFRCFCTPERLAQVREEQVQEKRDFIGYDGHCLGLSREEVARQMEAGVEHVVRMKVPRGETLRVEDRLRGTIEFESDTVDMQVLLKSDGLPTYHLANVVDDHLMEITHVMRGEEWITSAPKHLLLYRYFGWEMPQLVHLPLLRNPDKSKLSKRKNPTGILYYERLGILPQGLLNFLGMMGWSMPKREGETESAERFSLQEMVEHFEVDRISLGGPIFDVVKLQSINARWIREGLTPEQLATHIQRWALNPQRLMPLIPLFQDRIETLSDIVPLVGFIFSPPPTLKLDELTGPELPDADALLRMLQITLWQLESLQQWDAEQLSQRLRQTAQMLQMKLRNFMKPLFPVVSGSASSTPLFDTLAYLGPDLGRMRLRSAIEQLGGLGNKRLKKLQKEYDQLL